MTSEVQRKNSKNREKKSRLKRKKSQNSKKAPKIGKMSNATKTHFFSFQFAVEAEMRCRMAGRTGVQCIVCGRLSVCYLGIPHIFHWHQYASQCADVVHAVAADEARGRAASERCQSRAGRAPTPQNDRYIQFGQGVSGGFRVALARAHTRTHTRDVSVCVSGRGPPKFTQIISFLSLSLSFDCCGCVAFSMRPKHFSAASTSFN